MTISYVIHLNGLLFGTWFATIRPEYEGSPRTTLWRPTRRWVLASATARIPADAEISIHEERWKL